MCVKIKYGTYESIGDEGMYRLGVVNPYLPF